MAANLVDEIKSAEERSARELQEARTESVKRVNKAVAEAENTIKEARQTAARQFREKVAAAERTAETKAQKIVSDRQKEAETFYAQHKDRVSKTASWITEEVMVRYGRG